MNKLAAIFATLLVLTMISCQKDLDYNRPPGNKNSFEGDKIAAFKNLTDDQTSIWAWKPIYLEINFRVYCYNALKTLL